jgi:hypothetical protein
MDHLDDLWLLVRVPVKKAGAALAGSFVQWVEGFQSDKLFVRFEWMSPRSHPWRFACILGLFAGVCINLAQL